MVLHGMARHGLLGVALLCMAMQGVAWFSMHCVAWLGMARQGKETNKERRF